MMNYDSDDARNLSPPLEKQKIVYEPHESPPPFIPEDKSETCSPVDANTNSGSSNSNSKPGGGGPGGGGDPPNDPEIAYRSREAPLRRDSSSCSSSPVSEHTSGAEDAASLQDVYGALPPDIELKRRLQSTSTSEGGAARKPSSPTLISTSNNHHNNNNSAENNSTSTSTSHRHHHSHHHSFGQPLPRPDILMADPPNPSADPSAAAAATAPRHPATTASSKEGASNAASPAPAPTPAATTTTRLPSVAQIISNPTSQSPLSASIFQDSRPPLLATPTTFKKLNTFPLDPSRGAGGQSLPSTIAGSSSDSGSTVCQSLPSFRSSFPSEIVPDVISSKDHFLNKNGVPPQPPYPAVTSSPRQSHHSHSHSHGHHSSSQSHIRRLSEQFYPTPLLSSTSSTPAYSQGSPPKSCDIPTHHHQQQPPPPQQQQQQQQQHYWPGRLKTDHSRSHSQSHSQSLSQSSCEPGSQYSDSPSTGYPTPTDPASQEGPEKRHATPTSSSIASSGMFKCNYPGCVALPFQTQYLLNSHANVHSQFRPYYCPVQGCPRSEGGKGFKRKNEMIRHGLVHDSPGYVCPFCPDQRHRYPRPDNLQRHVRVHHIDKDREDPLLREVLAQRPEGANRGRRRRA
ncbi:hypothetical protein H102_02385 [Trichophyton rubrum CBS 100081]|nr:hypothetical protein H100_02388 [Trichophyton rubrum MR850]EZF44301.1 hypothetical protein H102_02385 [Trichophyton rubrum CBS 100081]KMQ41700.1 Zinc finger C2H2-type/integrase DNA-binding domain [Trichophyton rubrum]